VVTQDGKPDILTIPEGSIITVQEPPSKDTGMVPVKWESMNGKDVRSGPGASRGGAGLAGGFLLGHEGSTPPTRQINGTFTL